MPFAGWQNKDVIEPRGQELVDRYKKNYNIPVCAHVTEEMILAHWELEKRLTKELLESNLDNRWETFERCYSTLYGEFDWLNRLVGTGTTEPPSQRFENWVSLIGKPPKKVYEVGCGKGEMIAYLASLGFECSATEITRERGEKHVSEHPNLSWKISDGVHLERFEVPNSYDVVISNHVVEHLHPDDLFDHFEGVLSILSNGERYIFCTPNMLAGPSDISRVFNYDKTVGLHLKEYTNQELREVLSQVGFKDARAVLEIPSEISRLFGLGIKPMASRIYLDYLCDVEKLISLLPCQAFRRKAAKFSLIVLFSPSIFIIARKQ